MGKARAGKFTIWEETRLDIRGEDDGMRLNIRGCAKVIRMLVERRGLREIWVGGPRLGSVQRQRLHSSRSQSCFS